MDWFLYDNSLPHEKFKQDTKWKAIIMCRKFYTIWMKKIMIFN